MRIKKGFIMREVCGQKVIVAEGEGVVDFGKLLTVNSTAEFLFQEAENQGDFTVESLTDSLLREYDVDRETALKDVASIVEKWREKKVIE